MDVRRMASDNLILIVESIWSGLKMYVASWYFDQFFKKNLSHSADIVYCVCLFVITHIILSGKLLRFLINTDDGVCPPYSSCDEDDSTQSSIHNSYLLSSFYSHILWSKNMLLLSHYRFVTHQNVSSFLRNRLVQKIKILRIFLKIEICRRQSYGILLFNFGILAWIFLNAF